MPFEVFKYPIEAFSLKFEEQRIDELHDIIASHAGQKCIDLCQQEHSS